MTREEKVNLLNTLLEIEEKNDIGNLTRTDRREFQQWVEELEQEPGEKVAQERYADLCEYFGDAKDILKSRKDFKAWLERIKWHIHKAAEQYEKYEHKQEPCENHEEKPHSLLDAYFQMRAEEISPCEDETKECIRNCFECKWSSFYKTEQEQEDVEDDTLYETGAIICDSCGSEIAFCPYCGAELESGE